MKHGITGLYLACLLAAGGAAVARAAPQSFNTALPVARGEFIFREQFLYKRAGGDPSPGGREVEILGGIPVLA